MVAHFTLRTKDVNKVPPGFDDSFGVTKCLQQIDIPDLLHKAHRVLSYHSTISTEYIKENI